MRCENELGQQHEFVNVMLLSDFSRYDGFFNHLGMLSTYNNFLSFFAIRLIHYFLVSPNAILSAVTMMLIFGIFFNLELERKVEN
jgi:hypothetical protein